MSIIKAPDAAGTKTYKNPIFFISANRFLFKC